MTWKNTILKNKIRKYSEIEDILIFGSTVRGKENPNDTDIMIIFKTTVDKNTEYKIKKELEKQYKNISIISKTKKTVLEPTFDARESILSEAISLVTGKNLANKYGFSSLGLFKYNIKGWSNVQKTKFYYALNGRTSKDKGIVQDLNCIKLADNIILAPLDKIEPLREFLDFWKINYTYTPILIPERMNSKKILR